MSSSNLSTGMQKQMSLKEPTPGKSSVSSKDEAIRQLRMPITTKKKGAAPSPPKNGRSESQVYVLFVGQSGCGKSTTLNFLFGNQEIAPVERETGTDKIYEFTASLPGYADETKKLALIDIPGLGDMNSIDWDGRIIKSLDDYFKKHKDLSKKFPNLVVIVGRFDDNRIDGDKSSFVKMLKALHIMGDQLFDKERSNLMVVLTHYMNGKKALRADPTPRIQLIQHLVKTHLNYKHAVGVILAENEPVDWELEEKEQGSFELKKGIMYPTNFFQQMIQICESGEDKLGSSIIEIAQSKRTEMAELLKKDPIIKDMVDEIVGENTTAVLAHMYNSSYSSLMNTLHSRWNSFGKSIDDNNFKHLIKLLLKENIQEEKDIPKSIGDSLKVFDMIENKDIYLFQLLESVKFPIPDYEMIKSVGAGYNIGHDNFTGHNLLNFDPSKTQYKVSLLPHRLPKHIDCEEISVEQKEDIIFENLASKDKYTQARLKRIKFGQGDLFEFNNFHFESKPKDGYNYPKETQSKKQDDKKNPGKSDELHASKKERKLQIKLRKEFRVAKLELNTSISLPVDERCNIAARKLKSYNKKDRSIRTEWREFFTKWGSHVVKSVYVGGACTIEISEAELLRLDANFQSSNTESKKQIMTWLVAFGEDPPDVQCEPPIKFKVTFEGGNKTSIDQCQFPPTEDQIKIFQEWRTTLTRNPTSLETDLELMPVKSLLKGFDSLTTSYDTAFTDLFLTVPSKISFLERIRKFFNKLKSKKQPSKELEPTAYNKNESDS